MNRKCIDCDEPLTLLEVDDICEFCKELGKND